MKKETPEPKKGKYDDLIFGKLNPGRNYKDYVSKGRTEQETKKILAIYRINKRQA